MKLDVQGIEEIEITDPSGLCNLAALPVMPQPQRGQPIPPSILPSRPGNRPFVPSPIPRIPGAGDVDVTFRHPIYTRPVLDPNDPLNREKWGIGGPAIQQAGRPEDADKWEKNWQSKMSGAEGQANGDGNTSQS